MSASGGDGYKRSLFDKRGPEAAHHFQRATSLVIPFVAGALIAAALAARKNLSIPIIIALAFAGAIILSAWWWFFITRLSEGAGKAFGEFIQPSAGGSYERQYSREDAMVMRGDLDDDVFASNRLVDLYLAWPGHETKGLRELRRLIDTYPETDVAERARAGLVNLKSQLGIAE